MAAQPSSTRRHVCRWRRLYRCVFVGSLDICREVIAIEANPLIFPRLVANIQTNNRAVTAIQAGLSDKYETLTLHVQDTGNLGGSFFVTAHGGRTVEVAC